MQYTVISKWFSAVKFLEYHIKGFLLSDLRIPFRWFSTVEIMNTM